MPNNVTNFWVFDDDDQIINFLSSKDIFKDSAIDDEEHEKQLHESGAQQKSGDKRGKPKENVVPRQVTKLESLFDFQYKFKNPIRWKVGYFGMQWRW